MLNGYTSALLLLACLLLGSRMVQADGPGSIGLGGRCGSRPWQVCDAFLSCVSRTPDVAGASGRCQPCGRAVGQACCLHLSQPVASGHTPPYLWTEANLLLGDGYVTRPGPSNACQTHKDLGCFSGVCQKMNRCTSSAMVATGGRCGPRQPCQRFNNCVNGRCVPCGADGQDCCALRGSDVCNSEQCQGQDTYDQNCHSNNKCGFQG